jgi:hypothetical protein
LAEVLNETIAGEVILPISNTLNDEATIIIGSDRIDDQIEKTNEQKIMIEKTKEQKREVYARRGTVVTMTDSAMEVEDLAADLERELNQILGGIFD